MSSRFPARRPAAIAILAALLVAGVAWTRVTAPAGVAPTPVQSPDASSPAMDGAIGSAPLRHLTQAARPTKIGQQEEERERIPVHGTPRTPGRVQAQLPVGTQAAPMPAAATSFEGLGQGFTGPGGTLDLTSLPPDTSIAVGPDQIVEVVNTSLAVFDKAGTALRGPMDTNVLFTNPSFGGLCESNNDGDGVVIYDRAADRWVITWFAVDGADGATIPYLECVAVSATGDATGGWNRYAFEYSLFPDYPKIATWGGSYFVTFNMFDGDFWAGGKVCAYDRAHMLAGTPARTQQCFDTGLYYGGLLVADVDSSTLPPAGAPAPMIALDFDGLATWKLAVDWTTPANSKMTLSGIVPTAGFDLPCAGTGGTCVTQPGTANTLDTLGERLMNRLTYRNDGGRERMAVTHSVVTASATGIRWYELAIGGAGRAVSMVNQGTYAPNGNHRWMGSAARDSAGNLAVGYNVSGAATYPSLAWAGRLASDPANSLAQTETVVMAGSGSQTGDNNYSRWGDYSAMALDPVDECTFWFAGEYYPATADRDWHTRIASFSFPLCTAPPPMATITPSIATPTNAATIPFTVAFTVPVTGFDAVDLVNTGTAPGCVPGTPAGSGTSWTVDVTGCGEGTLVLQLAASTVSSDKGTPGPVNATSSATVTIDRTAPVVGTPSVTLRKGVTLASASTGSPVPVTISWSRFDAGGAPIHHYLVERSTDGGSTWQTVSSTGTATSLATTVPVAGTVRFRASGVDTATNVGASVAGRTLTARLVQQSSSTITYKGTWTKVASSSLSGGTAKYAKAKGASASYAFTGRSAALVMTKGPGRGMVKVYVNGVRVATVDLLRSATQARAVVWQQTWSSSVPRTVKVVVSGTSGRPRVDLDALIVIR